MTWQLAALFKWLVVSPKPEAYHPLNKPCAAIGGIQYLPIPAFKTPP
jgi:hypothetical protein